MEKKSHTHSSDIYKGIFIVAGLIAIVAFFYALREVFAAVTIAIVLFYMLDPIASVCTGRKLGRLKLSRLWGSVIAFIVGVAVITVFILLLIPPILDQVDRFAKNVPEYVHQADKTILQIEHRYQGLKVPPVVQQSLMNSLQKVTDESTGLLQNAAKGVGLFLNQIVLLFMIPFLTFYLLVEKDDVKNAMVRLFPKRWQDEMRLVISQSSHALRGYIAGQIVLSLIMAIGVTIALSIMGLKAPLLLGMVAGVTKLIPVIGIVIGCIPAALVALSVSLKTALWVVIIFTVVQLLENKIVLPLFMSKYVNLSPLTILCALMVGEQVGGVLGMFVATPVVAVMKVIYTHLRSKYE